MYIECKFTSQLLSICLLKLHLKLIKFLIRTLLNRIFYLQLYYFYYGIYTNDFENYSYFKDYNDRMNFTKLFWILLIYFEIYMSILNFQNPVFVL